MSEIRAVLLSKNADLKKNKALVHKRATVVLDRTAAAEVHRRGESVWIVRDNDVLDRVVKDKELLKVQTQIKRNTKILALCEPAVPMRSMLGSLFQETMILPAKTRLKTGELFEVMRADNAADLAIGAEISAELKVLRLVRGDLSSIVVPLEIFKKSGGLSPDFSDFSIEDYGQTLRFGKYEASVDSVLYEFDPEYRKAARENQMKTDKSFGACLRRLRLLKKVKQSDFEGLDAREIGRIERGEVKKPRPATLEKIARRLGVEAKDISTF